MAGASPELERLPSTLGGGEVTVTVITGLGL